MTKITLDLSELHGSHDVFGSGTPFICWCLNCGRLVAWSGDGVRPVGRQPCRPKAEETDHAV